MLKSNINIDINIKLWKFILILLKNNIQIIYN